MANSAIDYGWADRLLTGPVCFTAFCLHHETFDYFSWEVNKRLKACLMLARSFSFENDRPQ